MCRQCNPNGIRTALEASGLNLWGTKLVVLAACDTGVGEVRSGEGVHGLRRTFVLAGAESLVMRLWPVSDYMTRDLMFIYFKNLKQSMGRGGSTRAGQLAMLRRNPKLHPFYWANFIQSGRVGQSCRQTLRFDDSELGHHFPKLAPRYQLQVTSEPAIHSRLASAGFR